MNPHFQRAQLLHDQDRFDLAIDELRLCLGEEPEFAHAHALLALCLTRQERFDDAEKSARQAVHLAPDHPYPHYALAMVLSRRNRDREALAAINEAVRLDPTDADYHAVRASFEFAGHRWAAALAAAETGLAHDPEHVACNNLRAMSLVKLGRKAEAGATIDATLSRSPEDSWSHANKGWTLLEQGQRRPALQHFQEALRLDPTNDWARAGVVEAIKAGNPLYAVMLRYFLWMQRLSPRTQWLIILGGWFGSRLISDAARTHPNAAPYLHVVLGLYLVFAFLTWLADPFFNLCLRLHPAGRHALSDNQRGAANALGICLLGAALTVAAGVAFAHAHGRPLLRYAQLAAFPLLISIPLTSRFRCAPGWPRRVMTAYAAVLVGCLVIIFGTILLETFAPEPLGRSLPAWFAALFRGALQVFALGAIASPWVANFIMNVRPRR